MAERLNEVILGAVYSMDVGTNTSKLVVRIAVTLALVGGLTFLFFRFFPANATTAALGFMLLVLGVATSWGLWAGLTAAIASAMALEYFFLLPIGFAIADPSDWIALLTFVVCAVVTSQLSSEMRRKQREATQRKEESERLYAVSRAFMLIVDEGKPGATEAGSIMAQQLVQIFGFSGVVLFHALANEVFRAGVREVPLSDQQLIAACRAGEGVRQPVHQDLHLMALAYEGECLGSLAVIDGAISPTVLHSIANLAAITLRRTRQEQRARLEESQR